MYVYYIGRGMYTECNNTHVDTLLPLPVMYMYVYMWIIWTHSACVDLMLTRTEWCTPHVGCQVGQQCIHACMHVCTCLWIYTSLSIYICICIYIYCLYISWECMYNTWIYLYMQAYDVRFLQDIHGCLLTWMSETEETNTPLAKPRKCTMDK